MPPGRDVQAYFSRCEGRTSKHTGLTSTSNTAEHIGTDTGHGLLRPILPGLQWIHYGIPRTQSRSTPSIWQCHPKPGQLGTRLCTQVSTHNANSACRNPAYLVPSLSYQEIVDLFCTLMIHNLSCGDNATGKSGEMLERGTGAWGGYPHWHISWVSEYIFVVNSTPSCPSLSGRSAQS